MSDWSEMIRDAGWDPLDPAPECAQLTACPPLPWQWPGLDGVGVHWILIRRQLTKRFPSLSEGQVDWLATIFAVKRCRIDGGLCPEAVFVAYRLLHDWYVRHYVPSERRWSAATETDQVRDPLEYDPARTCRRLLDEQSTASFTGYDGSVSVGPEVVLQSGDGAKSPSFTSQIRSEVASALLARPTHLEQCDVLILMGFAYAARYFYPQLKEPNRLLGDEIVVADIRGVLLVVQAAKQIAERAGLCIPAEVTWRDAFWCAVVIVHDWRHSIEAGSARAEEVERQLGLIDHSAGLVPNARESAKTMVGILADNQGEPCDPKTKAPLNGEFAGPLPGKGKLLASWMRLLEPGVRGKPVFRWSENGGFELVREPLTKQLQTLVGKGRAKSKKETLVPDSRVRDDVGEVAPEVLLELRELRDDAALVPELQDSLDRLLDRERIAALGIEGIGGLRRVVRLVGSEEDAAMKGALLHALGLGTREALGKRLEVTPEAIRWREALAKTAIQEAVAA